MTIEEFYTEVNGDYASAIERFRSDELLLKYLNRYKEDKYYDMLMMAVEEGDLDNSFEYAHAVKGVVANFYLNDLYKAIFDLVEQLRNRTRCADQEIVERLKKEQERVVFNIGQIQLS